jgi:hypothetical protein
LLTLRLLRRKLLNRKRIATGISEEAINNASDVSHMKGCGRYTGRASVPFFLRQMFDDFADTLAHLQKDVRNWLKDGGDAVDWTALPPLSIRHFALGFLCCLRLLDCVQFCTKS